jgi:biopolymer transport protein ExbD
MLRRKKREIDSEEELNIDLTPMLDVVFIMLIFFIVTATFTQDSIVEVNRPQSSTATTMTKEKNFILYIKNNQALFYEDNNIDLNLITVFVKNILQENKKATAILYTDEKVNTGYLVSVMDRIRLGGIENIAISTEEK